ncbi:MAG: TonB-dependent receptor [Crocinitomicaceae bacterium]|nr:TonB-dependent receptor [Crocinitomicaceae bacterium]MDG1775885.1 TonB-dependent receptor [Crocinitomicaceae bacterium]
MKPLILSLIFLLSFNSFSQTSSVSGVVLNSINNQPIEFAKIQLVGLQKGTFTDSTGAYKLEGIEPGVYSLKATNAGFVEYIISDITITASRTTEINFELDEFILEKGEVRVIARPFRKIKESPLSLKTLNATEIEKLPGANRDASKVLQALPGVASPASFRNDIIIRGGSPGENKFYLDGIEVPNINHFATQGSSGGPVGLLNINFIRSIDFYSGALPSNYANGLSSAISFKQKEGNKDNLIANVAIGSSDLALTLDGPISKKSSFIFSVRRSYLQLLFAALKLPFLPTYNDAQFKVNHTFNRKNKISIIGLGALDDFVLNTSANDEVTDENQRELNEYTLDNIPTQDQWNYTIGVNYVHYGENSNQRFIASRNMLKNVSQKYQNNIEDSANLLLDYSSVEAENKFRFENTWRKNGFKVMTGIGYEYVRFQASTYQRFIVNGTPTILDVTSNLDLHKVAAFAQASKSLLNDRLDISLGIRTDVNSYSKSMLNPLSQLSPSLSLNYDLTEQLSISANVSRYNQLPSYTILGYRDGQGTLKNKENELKYIQADHFVLGTSYITKFKSKFSVEGFFKKYNYYPYSVNDSISLANLGSDFGIVGNEEVTSSSNGRAYGAEFLYQQKLIKGFYSLIAYTFVTSEFQSVNGVFIPSTWDSKHIVSLTGGKRFKKGWEVGFRWSFSGGAPYTPADVETSSLKSVWDINNSAVLDYSQLNSQRGSSYHQLNVRVDKRFNFEKTSLNIYLDIQNIYNNQATTAPILLVQKDDDGNPVEDPLDPTRYLTKSVDNTSGILQPSVGVILEFKVKRKKN